MGMQFQPLKLANPELFGIRLTGAVGRADKTHLLELVDKCLDKEKLQVVLDVSELTNLGGGGAAAFAEFQSRLVSKDGEAVFAGAQEIVQRFLQKKFGDSPLRFFPDIESAVTGFFGPAGEAPTSKPESAAVAKDDPPQSQASKIPPTAKFCEEVPCPAPLAEAETLESVEEVAAEVGAVSFFGEEFEIDDMAEDGSDPSQAKDSTVAKPSMPEAANETKDPPHQPGKTESGRRRKHSYTSLADAISALGGWSAEGGERNFGQALDNLLFSHGLAESAIFLSRHGNSFGDVDGQHQIPASCSLAQQLHERGQPLTLLDIQDEDLKVQETDLLEELTPDIMLPVISDNKLGAILFMKRTAGNEDYSVVEHFALELLMRVLSGEETSTPGQTSTVDNESEVSSTVDPSEDLDREDPAWEEPQNRDDSVAEVLLRLALDLPDAADHPHFWRIFARNLWPVLPMSSLAFLKPEKRHAQLMVGENGALQKVNFGLNRLKVFFKTMERPVATENLPDFFKDIRKELIEADVHWLVALSWEGEYQGLALFSLKEEVEVSGENIADLVNELFCETSRMLARFDGSHEDADVNLEIVTMLMGQREKRMFGSDEMTRAIVNQLRRLARAMGFPPDQERDLIYGCLLRDVGLMDKEDAIMGSPEHLDPVQWSLYRRHPEDGARLLEQLKLSPSIIEVVRHHHERFSGEGFPQALTGRSIPLTARVVTVVENYVGMIVGTDVREPVSPVDAARIMRDNLGMRYDPDIVDLFLRAVDQDQERTPVMSH